MIIAIWIVQPQDHAVLSVEDHPRRLHQRRTVPTGCSWLHRTKPGGLEIEVAPAVALVMNTSLAC
jgi:hypothetical protein